MKGSTTSQTQSRVAHSPIVPHIRDTLPVKLTSQTQNLMKKPGKIIGTLPPSHNKRHLKGLKDLKDIELNTL